MKIKKVLWLEDQYEDFSAYRSALFRAGYLVDTAESVSEAIKKLREEDYIAIIFDIKVLPGDDEDWIKLDRKKRKENPNFDSYLGLELLYSLFNSPYAKVKLTPPIQMEKIPPNKIIIFSVVYDIKKEVLDMGILKEHIVYKSASNITTLPELIGEMGINEK